MNWILKHYVVIKDKHLMQASIKNFQLKKLIIDIQVLKELATHLIKDTEKE